MEFKVTYRNKGILFTTVKAEAKGASLTATFDNDTGVVFYPVQIDIRRCMGLKVSLESDTDSSCIFPPSVPDHVITDLTSFLYGFHCTVEAARECIRKEQEAWGIKTLGIACIENLDAGAFYNLVHGTLGEAFDLIIDDKDYFQIWQHRKTGRYFYLDTEEFIEFFELERVGYMEYETEKTKRDPKGRLASALECLVCGDAFPNGGKNRFIWFNRKDGDRI